MLHRVSKDTGGAYPNSSPIFLANPKRPARRTCDASGVMDVHGRGLSLCSFAFNSIKKNHEYLINDLAIFYIYFLDYGTDLLSAMNIL